MPERQTLDRDPGAAPRPASDEFPDIETPVIDMQDLEHKSGPDTRVNTKGVRVRPELPATWNWESASTERR